MKTLKPKQGSQNNNLIDQYGRRIEYVRLSVTDKCNLRCFYCMPRGFNHFEVPENWLTFQEIERVISAFSRLGVHRVRITGGEPLVRKDLHQLVRQLACLPQLSDLSMSTNATLLAQKVESLVSAGLSRINVSLDSLRADRFEQITCGGQLKHVIDGLQVAKHAGLHQIKINMVVLKDINDDEIGDMVEFCAENGFILRFIENMPVGVPGREAGKHYINLDSVRHRLQKNYGLIPSCVPGGGPASYFRVQGTDLNIGFITPISQHFCETCNRVRLSVDGTLHLCLGQEHSMPIRPLLRAGISDMELQNKLVEAIALKPEKHEFVEKPMQIVKLMSMTGG